MSEQKRYTADELREAAGQVVSELYTNPFADMLRQAADAEEEREANEKVKWSTDKSVNDERDRLISENSQLKAMLEAVVKECERNEVPYRDDETFVEKTERIRHNDPFLKILLAARGESENENK